MRSPEPVAIKKPSIGESLLAPVGAWCRVFRGVLSISPVVFIEALALVSMYATGLFARSLRGMPWSPCVIRGGLLVRSTRCFRSISALPGRVRPAWRRTGPKRRVMHELTQHSLENSKPSAAPKDSTRSGPRAILLQRHRVHARRVAGISSAPPVVAGFPDRVRCGCLTLQLTPPVRLHAE